MNSQELRTLYDKAKQKNAQYKHKICVCCGAGCISSGSEEVLNKIQEEIKVRGLENEVQAVPTGCMGPCNQGPLVKFLPDNTIYQKVDCENIRQVVQSQLIDKNQLKICSFFPTQEKNHF
jgi:NADP-reducing hydrogenase subunit HndC